MRPGERLKNRDTPEGEAFWEHIDRTVAELEASKPDWQRKADRAAQDRAAVRRWLDQRLIELRAKHAQWYEPETNAIIVLEAERASLATEGE